MSLWLVLMMMNMVMPISGAMAGLRDQPIGWIGYGLASVMGAVLGSISVWMLWTLGRRVDLSAPAEDTRTIRQLRLLYWTAIVWPFVTLLCSGALSEAVSKVLLHAPP